MIEAGNIINEARRRYLECIAIAAAGALAAAVCVSQPNQVHLTKGAMGEIPFKPLPNNPPNEYFVGSVDVSLAKRPEIHKSRA